jgi:hypothetical protein
MDDMSGPERRTVLSATGSSRDCALAVGKILYSALQPYRNQWLIFRLRVPTSEHSGDRNLKLFPMHSTREVVKKRFRTQFKSVFGFNHAPTNNHLITHHDFYGTNEIEDSV